MVRYIMTGFQTAAAAGIKLPHQGGDQTSTINISGSSTEVGVCAFAMALGRRWSFHSTDELGMSMFYRLPISSVKPKNQRERERELRKEGREVPSRVRLREGPIGVRITLGQPTIGLHPWVGFRPPAFVSLLSCSSSCAIEVLWAFPVFFLLCICCVRT